jgi:hypothetical protein
LSENHKQLAENARFTGDLTVDLGEHVGQDRGMATRKYAVLAALVLLFLIRLAI